MASESWVGFARSPKPNKDHKKASFHEEISTSISVVEVFNLATSAAGLSSWLTKTSKSDVRTSGKIVFAQEPGSDPATGLALFSAVDLGRKAVIHSEHFGEINLDFKSSKNSTVLSITFSKMLVENEIDDYLETAKSSIERLAQKLGAQK